MPEESRRHHFLRVFYLKGWCRSDRVCEYSRPHRDVVVETKPPSATGGAMDFYTLPSLPEGYQRFIEDVFFRMVDQVASDALPVMLDGARGPAELSPTPRDGWSRFLLSLRYTTPARFAALIQLALIDDRCRPIGDHCAISWRVVEKCRIDSSLSCSSKAFVRTRIST